MRAAAEIVSSSRGKVRKGGLWAIVRMQGRLRSKGRGRGHNACVTETRMHVHEGAADAVSEKDARRCKQMGKGSRATARRAKRRPPVTCLTALSAGRGAAAANPCMSRGGSGRSGSGASVRRATGPTGSRPSRRSRRRGRGAIRRHTTRRVRHGAVRRHHDRLAVRWPHARRRIRRDEHLRGRGGALVSAGGVEAKG